MMNQDGEGMYYEGQAPQQQQGPVKIEGYVLSLIHI